MAIFKTPQTSQLIIEGINIQLVKKKLHFWVNKITQDAQSEACIRRGKSVAKRVFREKHTLLATQNIKQELREKTCIWTVALYGSENWTMNKCHKKKQIEDLRCVIVD